VAALHAQAHGHEDSARGRTGKGDRRFKDPDWEEHFLFDYIKQSYLIAARRIHEVVSDIKGADERTKKRIEFFTRNFIDALSPSNFALTNPEVFRETLRTHGQNLVRGLKISCATSKKAAVSCASA